MISSVKFPNPSALSTPGASCEPARKTTELNVSHGQDYLIPQKFERIIDRMQDELTAEEKREPQKRMNLVRFKYIM